ncbi:MAG: hypothetical protein GY950_21020, partial [bacterium]|nr:hypothetical protein [bacterium]
EEYLYYIPHVVSYPEFYPGNQGYSVLWVVVTEDGTDYEIDQDGDGVYELQYTGLTAGSSEIFWRANWPSPQGTLYTGASVRSPKPLQLVLRFGENHFGTFDSGFLTASLLPVHMWGDTFVVPADSNYLYMFAPAATAVTVTPPGQSSTDYCIAPRANVKLSGITAGTAVTADNPIYVLAVNCQTDQNFPWMYNVLPLSRIGNDYYHDSTYGEVDISTPWPTNPNLWITAVNDGTDVYIDENYDEVPEYTYYLDAGDSVTFADPVQGTHISSSQNIYVVNVENWATPSRGKYGGAATEYVPTSSYGTDYALHKTPYGTNLPDINPYLFIAAVENDTLVDIDFGWDGIDISNTVNKGDTWAVDWPADKPLSVNVRGNKGIQVIFRTDFAHNHHPGVNSAYTAIPLNVPVVEATIDIHPDTLNRKSKGKWVIAYIELPGGFNVEDIDIGTLAVTAVDENPIVEPIYAQLSPTAIDDYDSDGLPDLMVKFKRSRLIEVLNSGNRLITISGELNNGTPFEGSDPFRVIH